RRPVRGRRRRVAAGPDRAGGGVRGRRGRVDRGGGHRGEHRGGAAAGAPSGGRRRGRRALSLSLIIMALTFTTHSEITESLRAQLVDIWVDATNAGGAVGFVAPVERETVDAAAFRKFAVGLDLML